jgi:hypothetical protein
MNVLLSFHRLIQIIERDFSWILLWQENLIAHHEKENKMINEKDSLWQALDRLSMGNKANLIMIIVAIIGTTSSTVYWLAYRYWEGTLATQKAMYEQE